MLNDPVANALSKIMNYEKIARKVVSVNPASNTIKKILEIMNENGYIGSFEELSKEKGGLVEVNLLGQINKCGAIKPRFSVKIDDYLKFERRYLPGKDFGVLIVSTPKGIMTNKEAKTKKLGEDYLPTATKQKKAKKELAEVIEIPQGISATVNKGLVDIKGPKGTVSRNLFHPIVDIKLENQTLTVSSKETSRNEKKLVNTFAAHIVNMIKGATEGHVYRLKICSGHFPMNVSVAGTQFVVKNFFGEKKNRTLELPKNVSVRVDGDKITIESISKETAGQTASMIEELTKRKDFDPRKFQDGIYMTEKDGKQIK